MEERGSLFSFLHFATTFIILISEDMGNKRPKLGICVLACLVVCWPAYIADFYINLQFYAGTVKLSLQSLYCELLLWIQLYPSCCLQYDITMGHVVLQLEYHIDNFKEKKLVMNLCMCV